MRGCSPGSNDVFLRQVDSCNDLNPQHPCFRLERETAKKGSRHVIKLIGPNDLTVSATSIKSLKLLAALPCLHEPRTLGRHTAHSHTTLTLLAHSLFYYDATCKAGSNRNQWLSASL